MAGVDGRSDARTLDLAAAFFEGSVHLACFCAPVRPCACAPAFTYSRSPSFPPSRPKPLSRYPPKPLAASKTLVQLIQTVPAFTFGATSRARFRLSVQMLAASP